MNKKKLALEVFNSSEMKKIASLKSVDKAALIRMIAEEVSRSSIEEAMTPDQQKVNSKVQNYLNRTLKKNPDQWAQAVEDANNGKLAISGFDQLDDELKKFAIEKFLATNRTKEYLAQQATNIAQTKDVPAEEAAKAALDVAAPDEATPEAAEELANMIEPSAEGEGEGESGIVNAVSMLNSSIGYVTIAAAMVPGAQVALPALKALQLPAAVTASILQAAVNGNTAKAVAELVELLPVDKIPGFDKVTSKIAEPIIKRLGEELTQTAVKEVTEKMIKDLVAAGVVGIDKGIKIGEETLSLDSLTELSPTEAGQLLLTKAGDLGTQLLDYLKDNFLSGEDEPSAPDADMEALLQRFADFIKEPGIVAEQINYVIKALDLKDTKNFGSAFGKKFKREEIQALKSHFENSANGTAFFEKYFTDNPEFLERFNQILAGESESEPGEEEEDRKETPEEEVMSIPEGEIIKLSESYSEFVDKFMKVKTLINQSIVFGNLWESIKIFAGKQKSDLEQAQRAINFATASKEEDEEAKQTMSEASPEVVDAAMADRDADDLWSDDDWESTPEEEAAADQAMADEREYQDQWEQTWEEQSGQEAPPEEVKEEFKRNVLERLLVLKRHSDQIADVLAIYKEHTGQLTQGSKEAFKKYGESDPKALLYKLVNLLMKDINGLLQVMETLQPQQKDLAEALLEIEGEKFADKLRNVKAVNDFVVGETKVLLSIVQNKQQAKEPLQEQDMNRALATREKAIQIYDEMAKIKKYFPTVQPLDSEHQLSEVIEGFANVIKIIKDHVATMTRFKDDKHINPSSLESARDGLLTIKKVIMDLFGVADEGKIEAPPEDVASINPTGKAAIDDEGMREPTPVEVEWEEEDEEDEVEVGEERILTNRAAIERHMTMMYLPPELFKEHFKGNDTLMQSGGKFLEAAYDAFTLFLILTKLEDTEGQPLQEAAKNKLAEYGYGGNLRMDHVKSVLKKLGLKANPNDIFDKYANLDNAQDLEKALRRDMMSEAEGDDPGSFGGQTSAEIWDELDNYDMSGDEEEPKLSDSEFATDTLEAESINITKIIRGLRVSGIFEDEERVKDIILNVLNKHFKQKSKDLSFFISNATDRELKKLKIKLDTYSEARYPFKVQMDNINTFVKAYADDEVFAPDGETPAGDPEGGEEPAPEEPPSPAEEPQSAGEPKPTGEPTPYMVDVPVDEEAREALLAQGEEVLDDAIQSPEVQQKIEDLPDSGPELVAGVEELTMDILSGNEWLDVVQQVDLSLPDINLEPESPEAKQAVVDAVKADIEEKRPEIDLSGIDVDSLPELEPDMDEPAKIDMPDSPREIRRQAFNRKIRALKKRAKGRFDIGKAAKVLRDILNVRNINLKEGYEGGLEVKTLQDLHRALVNGGAFEKDENSMDNARLVADMMASLGIEFPDANEKKNVEEQLTAKLTPIIKEILNRTNNG